MEERRDDFEPSARDLEKAVARLLGRRPTRGGEDDGARADAGQADGRGRDDPGAAAGPRDGPLPTRPPARVAGGHPHGLRPAAVSVPGPDDRGGAAFGGLPDGPGDPQAPPLTEG